MTTAMTSEELVRAIGDATALRRAARVLRARSKRPKSIWLAVICKVLNDTAEKIDRETIE